MAIDLMRLSPEQLDKFLHTQSIIWRQKEEAARVVALREYYDGEHPVLLSDRQEEFIGKGLTQGDFLFSHNTVKSVVDTLRERLSVTGFTVNGAGVDSEGEETPATQVAKLLWSWWEENRLDAQQIRLHRRALRDGKSYVMVDYDSVAQRPRFTLHPVDDGTTGIVCHRDPENPENILFLSKYWSTFNPLVPGESGLKRKTIYLPHEIRKYILGKDGYWKRMDGIEAKLDEGDMSWPIVWRDWLGNPLGVALKEFENPGGSEVAQIIGLQNALNKSWLDLIAAADMAGFPLLVTEYAEGRMDANVSDDDDIDDTDEFPIAPGRMIEVEGKVHRIEGADLSQLINTIHLIVETIAGISRTPQYYLRPVGGDVPSGEALKQLESGLVSRAVERQLIFGQAWADVMEMAYRVARTFGPTLPDVPKLKVQTLWQNAATRNELTDAQRAEILQRLRVPDDEIFSMLGYSPKKIAAWKATKRSDQAATIANVATVLQRQQAQVAQATTTRANGANAGDGNGGQ